MFFDDRLATVLRQRATGEVGLRTQFRQLLDLLGQRGPGNPVRQDLSLITAAWLRMDALAEALPASQRAQIIREPGWRFHNAELAAHLADQEPEVTSAALVRAELEPEDWTALIPRLPVRARGFLRLRRDLPLDVEHLLERLGVHDRGLPRPAEPERDHVPDAAKALASPDPVPPQARLSPLAPAPLTPVAALSASAIHTLRRPVPLPSASASLRRDPDETGRSEISALVERIAQFRRERAELPGEPDRSPRLPLGEEITLPSHPIATFGFSADASGRIDWASSDVAPMVIGARLILPRQFGSGTAADAGEGIERAFQRRQPIQRGETFLEGAPAIAGDWIVDAQPRFSDEGHFTGYFGRFRRPSDSAEDRSSQQALDADRIRQLLHELRTPVTAVQGYAEVIQQQLFGPAPHEYRALAAGIAADAARILAGFEELDRLARLETGALGIERGEADLADLTRTILDQLGQVLAPRMAGIELAHSRQQNLLVAIDPDDAEALLWRLLATLGAALGAGEMVTAKLVPVLNTAGGEAMLTCELPAQLLGEDSIFTAEARPSASAINAGLFGAGFALRLARAEAAAAGGRLAREGDMLVLALPLLTASDTVPSERSEGTLRTG